MAVRKSTSNDITQGYCKDTKCAFNTYKTEYVDEIVEEVNHQELTRPYQFTNVASMKSSTKLKNGMVAETLGYYNANDGGTAKYLIRKIEDSDIEDNENIIFIGTSQVAEKIKENTLKFHSVAGSSATYIVEFANGKNMIIDSGMSNQWTAIKNAINTLGITKFDYMIVTHMHSDHIENIQNLINTYDFSNCVCWVGMKPDFKNHADDIKDSETVYDETFALLSNNGLKPIVPNNDSFVEIDKNTKLHFLNTSNDWAEEYYSQITEWRDEIGPNFNMFSLVTEIIHKNITILTTGDIERKAEEKITPYIRKCDLMTVPHHGVNRDAYKSFYYTTMPKYGICSYISDSDTWVGDEYKSFMYLKEMNCNLITPNWSPSKNGLFTFVSNGYNISSNVSSNLKDGNIEKPELYSNIRSLINYATQNPKTISLLELIENMSPGSSFRVYWWEGWEETFAQVHADIKAIFPNFNGDCIVELKNSWASSNKSIKIIMKNLEFSAKYYNHVDGWNFKRGIGYIDSANETNLIEKLKELPIGNYDINYYSESNSEVLANGGYTLHVNVVMNNGTNVMASMMAVLRDTGSSSTVCRVAGGYVNTEKTVPYVWHKLN